MMLFSTDAARWNAVQSREAAADGVFVYAVRTTRIYCRPVCKARLARRKNIEFYATNRQAQDAGYRACKRCKPQELGIMPHEDGSQRVRQLLQQFTLQSDSSQKASSRHHPMSLAEMAALSGLSKWHFHRVFKQLTGATPQRFFEMQRENQALQTGSSKIIREESQDAAIGTPESIEFQHIHHQLLSDPSDPVPLFNDLHLTLPMLDEPDFESWPQLTDVLFDQQYAELEAAWARHNGIDFMQCSVLS